MDDLLRDFLTESAENLTVVDGELVKLEADPTNKDVLQKIFRLVHTIKGTCGFIGLPRLEKLAHASENVLAKFRDGALAVTPEAITLVLESLDGIKAILAAIETTEVEPAGDDGALLARLEKAAAGALFALPVTATTAVEAAAAKAGEVSVASQSIRVNVDTIEEMMVMVSELVLTRNQLLEMVRTEADSAFKAPLQRLSTVTAELQESVMKTRLQPIGNAWAKLPRLVRDLGNELGKKIELQTHGADTDLDRQVLELIKDPLTHMVRNAADHGLETPGERRAAGKAETGLIKISAYHEGGYVFVEIADDGRGLPTDKIRAKVVANGLASEVEAARLSEAQLHRFVFHAGFSTATNVTNVSGRGVGMDVVRSNLELIGGAVDLTSTGGQGTSFLIKIPLTMAIMSALIVGEQGMRFAIPQACILELVRTTEGAGAKIERINDTCVLRLRDRLLPLVRLSQVLRLEEKAAAESYVVLMQAAGRTFGIVVDTVFDTGEIVVKPVSSILKDIPMYAGTTILGDGSVIVILDPNGLATAVSSDVGVRDVNDEADVATVATDAGDRQALLLFRAGTPEIKAVPMKAVARLEIVDASRIERSDGRYVLQYRGALMPIMTSLVGSIGEVGRQPVLVFSDGGHAVGVAVDEILDIVEAPLTLELTSTDLGLLGTAVIREKATEIVDISHHLGDAFRSWFAARPLASSKRQVLLIDDSPFFRTMMAPLLSAAGYHVTEASTAEGALKLRDEGRSFDIILSDIEMPGMGGRTFASIVKQDPAWRKTPVVGLAGDGDGDDVGSFDALARKFDREALMSAIKSYLGGALAA